MPDPRPIENDFLEQITAIIRKNLSNEAFGVSELADAMNMSRSNLLRKVKKETRLSVSQLISQMRLKRAMELLRKSSRNVSEVSHEVGFGSTSYFIKCFREYYGYPPGEVGKREAAGMASTPAPARSGRKRKYLAGGAIVLLVMSAGLLAYYSLPRGNEAALEKSIVVLPFINDSNDSTNLYFINGLMDATLNNLEKMGDLKVVSRTSSEKYRHTVKSVPEIAGELGVNYVVEGSGQKIGDRILLNIQLIEASTDRHLWSEQYRREVKDVFELQQEIARDIAAGIQVTITPEEAARIEKVPTDDLVAYDFFLKGKDLFHKGTGENLEASIPYFKKAIEHDNEFALAYATAAMVYYYLDIFDMQPEYQEEIRHYADKAMALDPRLGESLIAKALAYTHEKQYEEAIPYFEKALEYNPGSGLVLHFLTEFYHLHVPDPEKYLEYALKKVRLEIPSADSATTSHNYLQLSNAFMQTGFTEEALLYADKSIAYNPENAFAGSLRAFILFIENKDLAQLKELLIKELEKDTTRFDILLNIGKTCYGMRDYESAYRYFSKFIEIREKMHLDIFKDANLTIAIVLSKLGQEEQANEYFRSFKAYADTDKTIYKNLNLAMYYASQGLAQKAIEHFELFSKEDNYIYVVLLLRNDAILDPIKDLPGFKKVMQELETKFWNTKERIRETLEKKELL